MHNLNILYFAIPIFQDYHVALEETKKSYESKHMIYWIEDQVRKSITPQLVSILWLTKAVKAWTAIHKGWDLACIQGNIIQLDPAM